MKGKQQQDFRVEKYIRYGIRKYSFGAASVAIAAGLMFLGNGAVSANEAAVNGNGSDVAVVSANTGDNQDKVVTPVVDNKEVKEKAKPEVATPAVTPKVEESKKEEATKEEAAPKLDKSQLESYVNEVAGKLAAGKYANKTDESLALLNADLEAAKTALSNATSQDELKVAYNKLVTTVNSKLKNKPVEKKETPAVDTTNGKETVGKKAENTEKKSESNAIENTGSKDERNGKELVEGSNLRSANEGYTLASTELRKKNGEFATATGKTYKELDSNAAYRIYVKGFQSENTETAARNNPQPGTGARTDLPLSKTEAQKLGREAAMWNNKLRASGQNNNTNPYGSGGAYEYLATEIYGYTYEQGNHYVYLKDVTNRFELNDAAKAAGYTIKKVTPMNLPPGLGYNANSDTVEGYIGASIQNGVYDFRYELTVAKGDTEQKVYFRDLQAGWIGWQDSTAPRIQGVSTMVTIGEDVSHSLQYVDNDGVNRDTRANYQREDGSKFLAGSKTAPNSAAKKAGFVAEDGTTVKSMNSPQTVTAYTTLNGKTLGKDGQNPVSLDDTIPGLTYAPETGLITGKPTEAGIFTVAALAKDYNSASAWNMNGQEAHENITIAVAPKITVKNVEAYATNVPVTISNGANKAEITMPDGTVTKLVAKDGNWTVAAGTTNTAVQEGAVLGAVAASGESTINLAVTPESTKYVGVDSIAAKATTDKVQAHLQRETVTVKDHNNKEYTATFNRATGKYTLPNEDAYQLEESGDNSILTERRVYTEAQANGDVKLFVYEFTRTWNAKSTATSLADKIAEIRTNGEVTAVGDVFRTETLLPNDQTSSTQGRTIKVSYDSASDQWSASDGSKVTATKSNAGWKVSTTSGFSGYIAYREAVGTDLASIQNDKPTGTSTSYSETKGTSVDLIKSTKANVAFTDTIDDKTSATDSDTIKTKVTATAPDGTVTTFDGAQAEETAYIQAQRTAAVKTKAAAQAVKDKQDAQNDLASLQERLDRQTRTVEDAQVALDNLKLRTISPTAQQMAQKTLEIAKEIKAKLEADIEVAKGTVATRDTAVNASRQEALEAEKAVETARTALKTAAEANLAKANAYVLSQKGRYKVTARAVDSNGVVTTPTVDGTDTGEVTEDAVAETTYYIVVTEPKKTSGVKGEAQSTSMEEALKAGQPAGATVSDYKLVDPETGNKLTSVTTNEGTYTVNPTTGEVTFTPNADFVGNATPIKVEGNVTFNDESGNPVKVPVSNTYTPTVYGLDNVDDTTTGKQGQTQKSITGAERFDKLNTTENTPDGTNVDMTTAKYSLTGANEEGKVVVPNEGTYSIDPTTGVVTFEPLPTFKGKATGVTVNVTAKATDASGKELDVTSSATYTPTVTPVEPTGTPVTSEGKQGQSQTGKPTFTEGDPTAPITITEEQPAKFFDPVTKQPIEDKTIPAKDEKGNTVGKYTIDPLTGVVTFTPNKDFTGTPVPATVEVKDKNGTPTTATYTPTVTPVKPTGENVTSSGKQGQPQEGTPKFTQGDEVAPITINEEQPAKFVVNGQPVEDKEIPATKDGKEIGKYKIDPLTGVVTFTPNKDFTGTPDPATVEVKDKNGTPTTANYTPTVTPVKPTGEDVTTSGKQGQPQEGTPTFTQGDETAPITINEEQPAKFVVNGQPVEDKEIPATKDGKEIGKYTIDPTTGLVTFKPNKDFTGTPDPATVEVKDKNGTPATATYTPTVTPVTPTAEPKETTGKQGQPQTQETESMFKKGDEVAPIDKSTVKLVDPSGNEVTTMPALKDGKEVGTYTIDPTTGVITFQPNKDFTGTPDPAKVVAKDTNGTKVETTYTPTVTPVTPTAEPKETTGKQGQPQTQETESMFKKGDEVAPIDKSTVKLVDPSGNEVTTLPATKDGKEVGTYTIDPTTGVITFQPNKDFVGTPDPAKVVAKDTNGTKVETTYTPTVTPVTPTAEPAKTTDIQGKTQEGTPTFTQGDETVPITITPEQPAQFVVDGKPVTDTTIPATKDGKQIGTYTIDPTTGKVTFTPNKDFVGTPDPATVQVKDKNGTPTSATYTPTVTPVTPTADPAETTDIQGKEQTGKPEFKPGNPEVPMDDEVPATFEDGSKEKVIPGEGTYTVAPDGTVTFTPEKTFTGKGTGVTVKRVDKNGTPVTAKYTPTVTPVTPEGTPAETTDIQGKEQTGKPTFKPGNPEVPMDDEVPATFEDGSTTKTIPGEGTYKVNPDGTVTFTPEKNFTGKGTGVTVKRVDKNGTPVTAKYTPTVTPVTPEGTPAKSEGPKGQPQTGTPEFKPGNPNVPIDETVPPTFEDGTTTKVVPGEGTYTIDKDGKVTFTPEPQFTGTAKGVTVKRVDKNGTPVTATYTPTVRPDTKFVVVGKDGKETELIPSKDGKTPSEVIPGYKVVKTEVDAKGNTKHIYEKVTTTYKDKDGNVIPGTTTEEGTNPKKDIPGYRFVETKKLPNGDTEHVYEKVKTSFKDKEGNEIPNYPTEDGDQPKKDIPGYRFVETKKLPNGDIEHVYEKVTTPVEKSTTWVDENGNPLKPTENGNLEAGKIPGYEFVRTVVDKDGNVRHIFRKVTVAKPKPQPKRLANTGTTETNTGLAGLGMAILGGLLAGRRRKNDKN